jgi:photosystem II stability/assembly factor-like uncharacterized protein
MKKLLYKLLILIPLLLILNSSFLIVNCTAQTGWFPLYSGTTNTLSNVFFTNANTGYVVGGTTGVATVLKTTNAGNNWFPITLPTTYTANNVFFTDSNTGYIACSGTAITQGQIFKTTNEGYTWDSLLLPVSTKISHVYFINSNTGFASGRQNIIKTTNAGYSWEVKAFLSMIYIERFHFTDDNTGYACTYNSSKLLKTTDGGNSWLEILYSPPNYGYGICFTDAITGIIVGGITTVPGSAFILRTTNAGNAWENIFFNNTNAARLCKVSFLNQNTGYITGGGISGTPGIILKSTNAGVSWYEQVSNVNNGLIGNYFLNVNTGYAVGYGGTILKTTDGGGIMLAINSESNNIPEQFSLLQNYPNPFNPVTTIKFDLPKDNFVTLKIYDMLGREVAILVNDKLSACTHSLNWNASQFSSGIYFYRIQAGDFRDVKRMILIK